jgi:glyoxylase-like metal-dependent hydrolase (beta-lactamase superfamily II)
MKVRPEDEIGPQLRDMGITQEDIKTLVLTHFHTDHAGGLHHFSDTEILASGTDHRLASGFGGRLRGYLPDRWPEWFSPKPIAFEPERFGPFEQSYKVTQAGDVLIVPTPGHTLGHISVLVNTEDAIFFLAGDTSYSESLLIRRTPDGVSPRASVALGTMDRILRLARSRPLVYLPTHDPESVDRLAEKRVLGKSLYSAPDRLPDGRSASSRSGVTTHGGGYSGPIWPDPGKEGKERDDVHALLSPTTW